MPRSVGYVGVRARVARKLSPSRALSGATAVRCLDSAAHGARWRKGDGAHLMVLEAFLVATLLLGAGAYVATLQRAPPAARDGDLDVAAQDALDAVLTRRANDGSSAFDALVGHAWACVGRDDSDACLAQRPRDVDALLRSYLPPGVRYDLALSNGVSRIYLTPADSWDGVAVGASASYVPVGPAGLLLPALSCRDEADGLDIIARFPAITRKANVTISWAGAPLATTGGGGVWTSSVPAGYVEPAHARLHATLASKAGSASIARDVPACALGGRSADLQAALAAASIDVDGPASPGALVVFRADVSPIRALNGVGVVSSRVEVYSPMPDDAAIWSLAEDEDGSYQWRVPREALYGCYPAALIVSVNASETLVELQKPSSVCIGLPEGVVPIEPVYRVTLRAWRPDAP